MCVLLTSACGGGGGSSAQSANGPNAGIGWVNITNPSSAGTYQTDRPTVTLSGQSFTSGSPCSSIPPFQVPAGYQVTWSNGATGGTGSTSVGINCVFVAATHWDVVSLPLAIGGNAIRVEATDGVGNSGTATIVVTRTADTTPPTVTSTVPAAGATGVSTTSAISILFSESLDPNSALSVSAVTVQDSANNNVAGSVSYDYGVTVTFTPAQPLLHGMSYRVTISTSIRDANLNPLAALYQFVFTTL